MNNQASEFMARSQKGQVGVHDTQTHAVQASLQDSLPSLIGADVMDETKRVRGGSFLICWHG